MEVNTYTFEDKENDIRHIVWARNEEIAQKIIDIANECSPFNFVLIENYVRIMEVPFKSYEEVEKMQFEEERAYREFRKEKIN